MISLSGLSMSFGKKVLFENVSLQFNPGHRYGLVGANGSGKSTLLRILAGEEQPEKGEVNLPRALQLGFLKQDQFLYEEERVTNVVLRGNERLFSAFTESQSLHEKGEISDAEGHRLADLEEIIAAEDGYSAEARAGRLLSGLGIASEKQEGPMKALSGGYKLRVLLAQVLFSNPDILLLDEPTNHLDIVSIRWLEDYLSRQYKGLLILISHDREFLNRVCTDIADVDYETVTLYTGNYEDFVEAKSLAMEQKVKEAESAEKKRAELQQFVDRFKAKASKARQAQSKAKAIERIELPDVKKSSRVYPEIQYQQERATGKLVLKVAEIAKSFGELKVLEGVSFEINRGEKVAIVGPNGTGKSTLLKIFMGEHTPDGGSFEWGHEVRIAYFAQDHHEALQGNSTLYDWLYSFKPDASIGLIRGTLGALLFSGDDVHKKIDSLSGGEAARALIARMQLARGNVLILDEPTNHLDMESVASLEEALDEFEGTVLFVSHDKHFVSSVATRILAITPDGLEDFSGSYLDYLDKLGEDYLARAGVSTVRKGNSKKESGPVKEKLSYEERKDLSRKISKMKKDSEKREAEIARMEEEMKAIEELLSDPTKTAALSPGEIAEKGKAREEMQNSLATVMQEWESLQTEIEKESRRWEESA